MSNRFLLVAGNIGAGKTTITDRLATRMGYDAGFETVATNPFLADFYADMKQWAFHLQVYFLGDRAEQHRKLANGTKSAIIDRSIYEDAHIFARALVSLGNMSEREFLAYRQVYDAVVGHLPAPDLLLYLDCPVPALIERIHGRGRDMESGITADYLSLLDTFYKEWITGFDLCPVLTIPAHNLNFVTNETHIKTIIDNIEQMLAGKTEVVFPDGP